MLQIYVVFLTVCHENIASKLLRNSIEINLILETQGNNTTVFTLIIGTPYLLTILVLKFEIVHSTTS